jgi:hypothetical protein
VSFIGTLLGRRAAGRESWLVELRTARLRHLLGDLGAILDLSADADEKQDGDYILDRQYVISLAEQALDRADAVLFDLEVITGTRSSEAEERLLALHRAVQSALAKPAAADIPAAGEGLLADEPEYLLLREVRRELFAPASRRSRRAAAHSSTSRTAPRSRPASTSERSCAVTPAPLPARSRWRSAAPCASRWSTSGAPSTRRRVRGEGAGPRM